MDDATENGFPCSVARVTDLIGDPWTPLILRDAVLGVRRYDEFHHLKGIGRNTLSQRLRKLVEAGILATRLYQDNPPRNEYLLTDKGRDLFGVLAAMLAWGDRWLDEGAGPPIAMEHTRCGHEVHAEMVCSDCGEHLSTDHVQFRLGAGFPAELADRPDVRLRYSRDAAVPATADGRAPGSG
ncbi:winged helix-turn-helix transcriptional regulator [Pseudonocardia sp. GCM10023141]|uniref:winged helix-turn-helix transcriptional regulator n=1 Tax=Pseudonocardia sp. GCM10023141 TaxID=3252653 RepID=UPI003606431D